MKIKKIAWTSFSISNPNITLLTDPLMYKKMGKAFPKCNADVCLLSREEGVDEESFLKDNGLDGKIVGENREKVMVISSPGEFEIGGMMIRRGLNDDFFIIDEKNIRLVYMGGTDSTIDPKDVKDLGDVDVLILPVGDGVNFMDFDKLEKVISNIDPAILVPCAYKEDSPKESQVKSREEFIKHFGFATVKDENYLNVNKKRVEEEQKSVEVIFL